MADNVIGIQFGVAGGSSISGESGKRIKEELEQLSKQLQLQINVNKEHFSKQLQTLKTELEKTLGDLNIKITTENVTATQGSSSDSSGKTGSRNRATSYASLQRQLEDLTTAQLRAEKVSDESSLAYTIAQQKVKDLENAYVSNRLEAMANKQITQEQAKTLEEYAVTLEKASKAERENAAAKRAQKESGKAAKELEKEDSAVAKLNMSYAKLERNTASLFTDNGYDDAIKKNAKAKKMVEDFQKKVKTAFDDVDDGKGGKRAKTFEEKQAAVKALNEELINTQTYLKGVQKDTDTLGYKILDTFSSKIIQTFSYALINLLVNAIRQVYQNVVSLDKAITDLQIASGKTREETKELVRGYSDLAKQLGATTLEVAEAADAWLRQGYSLEETNQLITDSAMLSKLGQIDSAAATKALTSAMKGYKVEVADATKIVDKFTAVDMKAAVSAGDIATAMAETATSADIAGVSMDTLIGYIATVAEVTQDGAESVGK